MAQAAANEGVWSSGTHATEQGLAQSHLTEASAGGLSLHSTAIMSSPSNRTRTDPVCSANNTADTATRPGDSAVCDEVTADMMTDANTEAITKHAPQIVNGAILDSRCTTSAQQQQFQQAVQLMLAALRRSVILRCQCIDDHGQLNEKSVLSNHAVTPAVPTQGLPLPVNARQRCSLQARGTPLGMPEQACAAHSTYQYAMDSEAQPQHQQASTRQDGAPQHQHDDVRQPQLAQQHNDDMRQPQLAQQQAGPEPQQQHQHFPANQLAAAQTAGLEQTQEQLQPAPVLILFSGGVDSTLIAALAHQSLPGHVPIDLASVCFQGGKSTDRLAAQDAVQELAAFAPDREWRLIEVDSSLAQVDQHRHWLLGRTCFA